MKKLAMIGCGGIGSYHLGHFVNYTDVELAGFCDLIPERAQSFVDRAKSGKAFTDFVQMYDEIQPDMVFICVPPYCHGDIEFETIKRGIPFFVEKPLSLDVELARKIRDEVKAKKLITASGFQCRYSNLTAPAIEYAKNNQIAFIDCTRIGGVPGVFWWRRKELSGGQAVEQTIHQFDIIRCIFGEPESVFTYGTRGFIKPEEWENYDTDDLTTTVVRFKSGALATISTGCYATAGASFDSKITFSSRDSRCDLKILESLDIYGLKPEAPKAEENSGFVVKGDGALTGGNGGAISYKEDGQAGILCDRTFVDAVLTGDGSKIRSPYEDAYRSLIFTMSCNKSMETGMPVAIDYSEN